METEAGKKKFDCVKWTRETRDRISAEIRGMSREEVGQWFENRRPKDPFLAELFDRRKSPTGDRPATQVAGRSGAPLPS